MIKTMHARSGFTLIELLITISIMSFVVGGSIVAYITFQNKQEVLTAAKDVKSLVNLAQGKARVKETPTEAACSGANKLQGYRIKVSSSPIKIVPLCGSSFSNFAEATPIMQQNLPASVVYTGTGPTDIDFYTLYKGVVFYPTNSSSVNLEFTSSDGSIRYRFTVNNGGGISDVQAY